MTDDSDDRIKALIVASLDAELGPRLNGGARPAGVAPTSRTQRSAKARWAPLAAAAAVLAVGVAIAAVESSDAPSPAAGPVPGVQVTCVSSTSANPAADRSTLLARANKLVTSTSERAAVQVSGASISVSVPGSKRADVADLCRSASVQLRPLVAPAVTVSQSPDPGALDRLGFALPATERAYDRLAPAQQKALVRALSVSGCPTVEHGDAAVVACGRDLVHGGRTATLLGAPVITGTDVSDARAVAPNPGAGQPEWTVSLTFGTSGSSAWAEYTREHNISQDPNSSAADVSTCGSAAAVPCADFVGVVVDGSLVSIPVTEAPITGGSTQISGNFDAAAARSLAADLRAGQLTVPLNLRSVTTS